MATRSRSPVWGRSCAVLAAVARRRVAPPERPGTGRVFAGIGLLWTVLVLFGAVLYAATGSLARLDDALVESAAGFTTTSLTLLDAAEASRSVLLFRAATSWVGGLTAVWIGVVTLPIVLRSTALIGYSTGRRGLDLVPSATTGRRRVLDPVLRLHRGLRGRLLAVTGLGVTEALVVGLGTASTGGFTGQADSLAGYGGATQAVAGAGMFLAGAGIFVIWWIARGRLRPLWRSQELRAFVVLLAAATAAMALHRGVGWGEAAFMAVSAMSTTGFAVVDWTGWGTATTVILLVAVGIGSMMGSAGRRHAGHASPAADGLSGRRAAPPARPVRGRACAARTVRPCPSAPWTAWAATRSRTWSWWGSGPCFWESPVCPCWAACGGR